ncbi:dTDP-glucose 4,6-dehydratase [Brachyspira hyodysenteriae]|uniref:dTDP-glucose 4,6-dehydratase n=1 Tax=Brachyspira hyodysenteriae TaxID=159 RepID=F5CBM7_BRAHO|nr:dTDP-glucose 4,6-dehydratase [Brachyspira hyodysenteriae]AEC11778.1 dTDP-glucose 4,6-dehydratase [Brachyspira hyodysenteriae]AEC11786.1 dTDP-glucose 4,6-dehydratase [Brachyspira hyodysenteriae]KLI53112.1 dTDP-glucose 4,6-dehydratase [Brachyspira hyodysenteriae]MDA0036129.1 dTDP-glucose 4,6-dehydratase [Brachyspira hyodysenteriae]MDA0050251.1 dTDP-glucose 4,6-dehydratase [Brachyspira hyodysenteriae]
MRNFNNILVTGGCGFIGSNFIRYILEKSDYKGNIINIDALTYAGNRENLIDIEKKYKDRYFFEKVNICDDKKINEIFSKYNPDCIVHFAAESHVDRSIYGPKDFLETNIMGTFILLEAARKLWENNKENKLFHHISTDEVYGSLGETGYFYETTPYDPRSPYSSSKASSDHIVKAYYHTYNLPVTISNCSNNYGPYQFPEKLIPLMISNIVEEKDLPVYGDGKNIRDWIFVEDHNNAVIDIIHKGRVGETYNIGGENEITNIDMVNILCEKLSAKMNKEKDYYKKLIKFVKDRAGHDRRYAINCDKIKKELGWERKYDFNTGIDITIDWYLNNKQWIDNIKSGEYKKWIELNYSSK